MRVIEFDFPDCAATVQARLEERDAPQTCEVLWSMLEMPLEETLKHAWGHLPELWFFVPPAPELPLENATMFPDPGNVMLFHYDQPGGGNFFTPGGREMAFDLGLFYAQGFVKVPPTGWISGNHAATITDVGAMAPVVAHAIMYGDQHVIARRVEP